MFVKITLGREEDYPPDIMFANFCFVFGEGDERAIRHLFNGYSGGLQMQILEIDGNYTVELEVDLTAEELENAIYNIQKVKKPGDETYIENWVQPPQM